MGKDNSIRRRGVGHLYIIVNVSGLNILFCHLRAHVMRSKLDY